MASKRRNSGRSRSNQSVVTTGGQDLAGEVGRPLQVTTTTHQVFSGPLPPPAVLAGYNNVVPNAAERIVAMAEAEQKHRHTVESAAVNANIEAQQRQISVAELQTKITFRSDMLGQALGFVAAVICFGCAFYFGATGNAVMAGLFLGPTVLAIVVTMLSGRRAPQSSEKA